MAATISPGPGPGPRAGLPGTIASEWTKLRTLRSTYWLLAVLIVGALILGIGMAAVDAELVRSDPSQAQSLSPAESLSGFAFAAPLLLSVLGALTITAEYSTGMIRTTLTAQPRRGTVFAAKATVLAGTFAAVSLLVSLCTYFLGEAVMGGTGHYAALPDPAVPVAGIALYATLIGLTAFALGVIIRHTAGAIATMAGILFILPLIAAGLSAAGISGLSRWLPTSAGDQILAAVPGTADPALFSGWAQMGVTAAWTVILLGAAAVLLARRDA